MSKVDKESETKKSIEEKNKVASKWKNLVRIEDQEEPSSSSSMSMYSIDSDRENLEVPSRRSPTLIEVQIPEKQEEVYSSPTMDKNMSKRNSVIQE